MKNNKILIVVGIILINIVVIYTAGQSLLGKTSKYDAAVQEARQYAEQYLCSKSIAAYNELVLTEDTLEIRLEMIDVYGKGLESGEFNKPYNVFSEIITMVNLYKNEVSIYEAACDLMLKHNKLEDCAKLLMQARDVGLKSEKLNKILAEVQYAYTKTYAMYTDVLPTFNGMQTVITEQTYSFLNSDASPELDGGYVYASSFSEGYAFVKTLNADGTEKGFVINKEGQRQFYIDKGEISAGVGKAKNEKGEDYLLLACKVGKKYKYFDINGKEVLGEYVFAGRFRNNIAAVQEKNGQWKLIDGTGKAITKTVFEDVVLNEFDECAPKGLIIAKKDGKYSIYDMNAKKIGNFSCDGAKAFVDEYAAFKQGDLWGFVDSKGKIIIKPQYEDAKSFSNGMGAVKLADGWRCINPKNKVVVDEIYEDIGYLNEKGICFVKIDGYWSYIKMYYTNE